MGKCSFCNEEGHNKTTCSKRSPQKVPKSAFSTASTNKLEGKIIYPVPSKPPISREKGNNAISNGEIIYPVPVKPSKPENKKGASFSKDKIETLDHLLPATEKLKYFNNKIDKKHSNLAVAVNKEKDLIKKIERLPGFKEVPILTVKIPCDGCQTFIAEKKCSSCNCSGHNVKTCPNLYERRVREKAEKESGPAPWLSKEARVRFRRGPTEKDGPGYIYMYTYSNPKSREEGSLFKIGMSEHEDGKRRIHAQEQRNKEQYKCFFHDSTPLRYLTETVIHLHLKDQRAPREQGDGRTEWFSGNREEFLRIVKDVIREVIFAISNNDFKPVACS